MNARRAAVFFGGCVVGDPHEEYLAEGIGCALAQAGFELRHGGYNGLMEAAARGAAGAGGRVVAISLSGADWGGFNPHVTESRYAADMGRRLEMFLGDADLVVAMGGGIGTLHELTAAIWYAGNIRPTLPLGLAGGTALDLLEFLRAKRWIYSSPTRPTGFLRQIPDLAAFEVLLASGDVPGNRGAAIAVQCDGRASA